MANRQIDFAGFRGLRTENLISFFDFLSSRTMIPWLHRGTMRPKQHETTGSGDLLRATLEQIINMKHELVQLAGKLDWAWIDGEIAPLYSDQGRPGILPVHGCVRALVHDPVSVLPVFRTGSARALGPHLCRLGDKWLLAESLRVAHQSGALRTKDLARVTVDTTVQPKNITFPTDAKLLHAAITRWTKISKLNVIDEFTHECLAIRIARKLKTIDVIDVRSDLFILRGVPGHIRSDNGPKFVAKAVQEWITAVGAKTAYITPGSPWENGYIESSNARLRDELLDGEIFYTLREAQIVIESWRRHFNTIRPHESLGYKPPAPEVFVPAFAA